MNGNPGGMSDMELGALVQQVKTVLDNQGTITQTLDKIFEKVEANSKEVMDMTSQLKSHLDTSDIRTKEWDKDFVDIKNKHSKLKGDFVKEKDKNITHRTKVETTANNAKWIPILISLVASLLVIANLIITLGGKG